MNARFFRETIARAKVNLSLGVTGRRPDGYHLIESVMHQVAWGDQIAFSYEPHGPEQTRLAVSDPLVPAAPGNLAYRAAELLRQRAGFSGLVELHLTKRIPMGAGLGGGSADAATTLTVLNEVTEARLDEPDLLELAVQLGADVPFAVCGGAALVQGIGERVTGVPSRLDMPVLLVHPRRQLATPTVFHWWDEEQALHGTTTGDTVGDPNDRGQLRPGTLSLVSALADGAADNWNDLLINDLEPVVCKRVPEVARVLQYLRRAPEVVAAAMTGSGSTVFALLHPRQSYQRLINTLGSQVETTLTNFRTSN